MFGHVIAKIWVKVFLQDDRNWQAKSIHFTPLSDHRASTKQFHCTLAVALASVQDFHIIVAYSCNVGHQILLSLPLVCCLYRFQLNSCFFVGQESLFVVYRIHFHFCSLIHTATGFCFAHVHISSVEIRLDQKILMIFPKAPVCWCVIGFACRDFPGVWQELRNIMDKNRSRLEYM